MVRIEVASAFLARCCPLRRDHVTLQGIVINRYNGRDVFFLLLFYFIIISIIGTDISSYNASLFLPVTILNLVLFNLVLER